MDERHDPAAYGDCIADDYDAMASLPEAETFASVEALARLAGGGPVLELGIGTGRVALPLASRGVEVHGIEASPRMIDKLRAKPGGDRITIRQGDFSDFDPGPARYELIYVVFSTFFALLTQDAQVRCFASAARALRPGGRFLLEVSVPDPASFQRGQHLATRTLARDHVRIDAAVHDPVRQRIDVTHIIHTCDGRTRFHPFSTRYAWPSELDLMGLLAGLQLESRWGHWDGSPFHDASLRHISVYRGS
jgi:SAM-dependent methyltransferase